MPLLNSVAQWCGRLHCCPTSKKVLGLKPTVSWGLSVEGFHVLRVPPWVLSRYSGVLPQSRDMRVRLMGDSKLAVAVSMNNRLSALALS